MTPEDVDLGRYNPIRRYYRWARREWEGGDLGKVLLVMSHLFLAFLILGSLLGLDFNGQMATLQQVAFLTAVYAMLALALNLHWGYAGMFNIGVAGFMAIGVYTMAMATAPPDPAISTNVPGLGLPLWAAVVLSMIVTALVGLIAALPALRLRADYFAIVTIAFAEIIRRTLNSTTFQRFSVFGVDLGTGGASGISLPTNPIRILFYENPDSPGQGYAYLGDLLFNQRMLLMEGYGVDLLVAEFTVPPIFLDVSFLPDDLVFTLYESFGIDFLLFEVQFSRFVLDLSVNEPLIVNWAYTLMLVPMVAGFYWLMRRTGNSPFGRVLKAIREDEEVAQALGKDTRIFKIKAFMLGCALMGLGGMLWQGSQGFTNPVTFLPVQTFYIWIALIIGGAGSNTGSVLGSALFAGVLFEGPNYIRRLVNQTVEFGSTPNNFFDAVAPFLSLQVEPFLAYTLDNIAPLRFVLVGVLLVWLMQNRPEGLLGHRSEVAAAVPTERRDRPRPPTAEPGDREPLLGGIRGRLFGDGDAEESNPESEGPSTDGGPAGTDAKTETGGPAVDEPEEVADDE